MKRNRWVIGLGLGLGLSVFFSGLIGCEPGDVPVYDERQGDTDTTPGQDSDGDFYEDASDCNDRNAAIHPGAAEICGDDVDQDCDGVDPTCDETPVPGGHDDTPIQTPIPEDYDGDGYPDTEDCHDFDASIHPGATELCDGIDNNCDGAADEGFPVGTFYEDGDGDGYGITATGATSCEMPGLVALSGDCNDQDESIHPNATEICNGVDEDCDGWQDDGVTTAWYQDDDFDGYGNTSMSRWACSQPSGYVSQSGDCDDTKVSVYPGAVEQCDNIDNDCDGSIDENSTSVTWYYDADSDGYGTMNMIRVSCLQTLGYVSNNTDCNDADASVHPGATEVCNFIDDDCDGSVDEGVSPTKWYRDADGDTYGTTETTGTGSNCFQPSGYVSQSGDCNDSNTSIYPGATETCNSTDDDCDGSIDEGATSVSYYVDGDGDGYGKAGSTATMSCTKPTGYVSDKTDCVDTNAAIHPGAVETTNGVDDDCDGTIDEGIEAKVEVNYSTKNTYTLNAQVFTAASQLGSEWDEIATVTSANAVSVEFTTAKYGSLSDFCGVRLNVSVGNPAYDWLCEGGAIDSSVKVDIWWKGTWYNQSKLKVWVANSSSGSCSAVLLVSTSSQCQF